MRHDTHITVTYSFDCGAGIRNIGQVLDMADETFFFTDIPKSDITISMNYYTHAITRNGRVIAPDIEHLESR